MQRIRIAAIAAVAVLATAPAQADDAEGCADHGALSRYPGSALEWCQTDNFLPYRVPVGPVTGYRAIGDWIDIEGRVTRNFYSLTGGARTHAEVWQNYREALAEAGFEIIAEGLFPESNVKGGIGGGGWLSVYYINNPWQGSGAVGKLAAGTSTAGGTGAVFGRKERADDTIYVLVSLEQHSSDEVAAMIAVVETKPAETGLVVANAEAMGRDIEELGRTVLHGLQFAYDEAALLPESKPALDEIARFLKASPAGRFYVVGHTDAKGTHAYNMKLSADRALAVRAALVQDYGIAPDRLEAAGVGPLVPVFTNATDGGRAKNRRVELVARE